MKTVLVTGAAGFFGSVLVRELAARGIRSVGVDLQPGEPAAGGQLVRADIRDATALRALFAAHKFDAVLHCAAMLAHAVKDENELWESNVGGTRVIAEQAIAAGVRKLVFISSNCLWGGNRRRPLTEEDPPDPIEIYGKSKAAAERLLLGLDDALDVTIFRVPTIVDEGRLGLLAILFEFIADGKTAWVVGSGANRYQFIYAKDLAAACALALDYRGSGIFNVGSEDVRPLSEVFQYVADQARTGSRVRHLPAGLTIAALRAAHALGVSPLGPYHYRMITEDFEFDTRKLRREMGWRPTLRNEEMLLKAYRYFEANRAEIGRRRDVSAHRQGARMGIIRLLKWVS